MTKNGKPNHPQTRGKIERFHQTLKRWLATEEPAATLEQLNEQLLRFAQVYNTERPHRTLEKRTPDQYCTATPKAAPQGPDPGWHHRVRTDRIDAFRNPFQRHHGRLLHVGVGRGGIGKDIMILVADNDATVIETNSGEILAEFTLDATNDYRGKGKKPPAYRGPTLTNDVAGHI